MASSRQKGNRWEFCIRRKGMLPRPVYFTFRTAQEGKEFCDRIERLLDSGIVPEEVLEHSKPITTISQAYEIYVRHTPISLADESCWPILLKRYGNARLADVDYQWVENKISILKESISPSTIRHYVGCLARLWDWLVKRQSAGQNPFRMLRKGYATGGFKEDISRDRRIDKDEEIRLICELEGDLLIAFLLALETAMRLREIYTLTTDQIDIKRRTIFLDKTKNGDKRQVPLSTTAVALLGMIAHKKGMVFDLWDGKEPLKAATARLSVAFARKADKAGCPDVRFHDTRHEATSRFFERTTLDYLEIAKITGHKDVRSLMRYANLRASSLAESLW